MSTQHIQMNLHERKACIIVFFMLLSASAERDITEESGPLVKTRYGDVRGKYLDVGNNRKISEFLGIPYALPPVGELRFSDPVPGQPWAPRVLKALNHGPACFHQDDTIFPGFRGAEMWNSKNKREDCLYLDIWVRKETRPTDRLPVMIWIYGGSFYSGSSSLDVYNGATLAQSADVIVVSINYRLGPLGFLPPMAGETAGNAGFHDQILALKWVRDNIGAFGGDSDRVTLFGESAGAASIGLHTVSPLSRGLFNRVILQSGNQLTPWATIGMDASKSRMHKLAENVNCLNEEEDESLILDCLRSKTATEIFDASWVTEDVFDFPFIPVIGTTAIPEDPRSVTARGEEADVDILLGWNSNEGSYFNVYVIEGFNTSTESIISKEQYSNGISKCGLNLDSIGEQAVSFFYSNWKNPSDPVQYRDALDQIIADYHVVCPTLEFAKLHRRQSNVYAYHLSYRLSNNPWPKWMGVMHGYEIELVFGIPMLHEVSLEYNNRDRQVARRMLRYWTNFAKYGNPNGLQNHAEFDQHSSTSNVDTYWPAVGDDEVTYLELAGSRSYVRRSPNSMQCAFWNKYIPSLQAASLPWSETESRWKLQFHRWEDSMDNWERSFERYTRKQKEKCLD